MLTLVHLSLSHCTFNLSGMNVDDSSTSEIPKLSCHASSTCLKLDKTGVTEESPINLSSKYMYLTAPVLLEIHAPTQW